MINLLLSCFWMSMSFTDKLLALVCIWKLVLLFPFLLLLPKAAWSRSSLNWLFGGNHPIRCTNRYIFSFKKKRSCIHHCGRGTRIGWKFGPNQFLSCAVPGQCTASRQPKPPKKRKRGCTLSLITLCFLPVIVNFAHGAPTAAHTKSPISSRQSFIPRTPQTAAERNAKRRQKRQQNKATTAEDNRRKREQRRNRTDKQKETENTCRRQNETNEQKEARAARQRRDRKANGDDINRRRQQQRRNRTDEQKEADNALRNARYRHNKVKVSNQITFQTETLNDDLNTDSFEQDPEVATMLWPMNSGSDRFEEVDYLLTLDPLSQEFLEVKRSLADQVKSEALTNTEKNELIETFYKAQGRGGYNGQASIRQPSKFPLSHDCPILTCASCGIRDCATDLPSQDQAFRQIDIHKDLSPAAIKILSLSDNQLQNWRSEMSKPPIVIPTDPEGTTKEVSIHKLRSIHQSRVHNSASSALPSHFHLHPEFVTTSECGTSETAFFCQSCHHCLTKSKPVTPPNSLASGLDFGDYHRMGLTKPNPFEVALMSKVRHHHHIVKIQPNGGSSFRVNGMQSKMKAHCVLFEHDAPTQSCLSLILNRTQAAKKPEETLAERITIQFIGEDGEIDHLVKRTLGSSMVTARAYVLHQWLQVLQAVNPLYSNDPPLPSFDKMSSIIKETNRIAIENADIITDDETIRFEATIGDGIAGVRTRSMTTAAHSSDIQLACPNCNENDCSAFTYAALCSNQPTANRNRGINDPSLQTVQLLEQTAKTFDIDVEGNLEKWYKSARSDLPTNEFDKPDFCLCGAFPHIFIYGSAYRQLEDTSTGDVTNAKPTLVDAECRHLLLQHTTIPATCRELIFYLFDQKQRHAANISMWTKVHANPDAFQKFGEMMSSDAFASSLKNAIDNPKGKEAADIMSQILPVLSSSGRKIGFGAMEKSTSVSESIALTQRHGPASVFLTVSPNDISNPTSFRLAFRSVNNKDFPATIPSDFIEK